MKGNTKYLEAIHELKIRVLKINLITLLWVNEADIKKNTDWLKKENKK